VKRYCPEEGKKIQLEERVKKNELSTQRKQRAKGRCYSQSQ